MNFTQKTLFIFLTTLALGLAAYFYTRRAPSTGDIQLNIKSEYLAPGSVRFEGTIMNTGDREIEEFTVAAGIRELRFLDQALNNCEMVASIAKVKNLKAREIRPVVWYFNSEDSHLEGIPKGYNNDEPFNYRVDWATNFKWRVWVDKVK